MKNTEATRNLQEATEARRLLQSQGIDYTDPRMVSALAVERIARYEVKRFQMATMAEGFRWNR